MRHKQQLVFELTNRHRQFQTFQPLVERFLRDADRISYADDPELLLLDELICGRAADVEHGVPRAAGRTTQALPRALQRAQVRADEADGVVDFMRHASRQLPDGGHFFGLQQVQFEVGQFGVGDFEFTQALLQ